MLPTKLKTHLSTLFALFLGRTLHEMGKKYQYLAQNDHNCICWTKIGWFWAKNLIFMGANKSFGNHITEKPPRQLVHIVLWSGIGSNGQKMPIFGQKCQFWAKFGRFWAKNPFLGEKVKLLVPSYQEINKTPLLCLNIDR